MFDCVTGVRPADGFGCILADDMVKLFSPLIIKKFNAKRNSHYFRVPFHFLKCANLQGLGKTFQSIALMYTLLTQGPQGIPVIRRAAVVSNEHQMRIE